MMTARYTFVALGFAVSTAAMFPIESGADFVDRRVAVARPDPFFGPDGKPQKLDFNFDSLKGWLRNKGGFHIEGYVGNQGFICSTYEVGMRFGIGDAQCKNVNWVNDVAYMTRRRQCNNATVGHVASDYNPDLVNSFSKINCAERVIRCTGPCTTYVAPSAPSNDPTNPARPQLFGD